VPMTVVVTRDAAPRVRGFLASCMLEIAPGVYTSPKMTRAIRDRVWSVLVDWMLEIGSGGVVLTWFDPAEPGGQGLLTLGIPPKELHTYDGIHLVRTPLPEGFEDPDLPG